VRDLLLAAVGESTFDIWLARLELIAVDLEGTLMVSEPPETVGWVGRRFGRVLDGVARRAGRRLRVADDAERKAAESLSPVTAGADGALAAGLRADALFSRTVGAETCPVDARVALSPNVLADRSCPRLVDQAARKPTDTSAYPFSYTDVYTQTREVS
jgi:hypothetical protein